VFDCENMLFLVVEVKSPDFAGGVAGGAGSTLRSAAATREARGARFGGEDAVLIVDDASQADRG